MRISLTFLILLTACGEKRQTVKYGVTTKADLVFEKGAPSEENPASLSDATLLSYANGEKYQIQNDIVTFGLKNPKGDERLIIFWKHKFRDCLSTLKQINHQDNSHAAKEFQLSCDEQGLAVTYLEGSDFVQRLIEYEKK
jgi:hypothetical protein